MRCAFFALAMLGFIALAHAATPVAIRAEGAPDGKVPGWSITAQAPSDWTADCCTYARAIGVYQVVYRGEWSGNPQRVMVLNVWPNKQARLRAEITADAAAYRKRDARGQVRAFAVAHPTMQCEGQAYAGSDRIDDVVVFCDPGGKAGARLSWSMSFNADDAQRKALLQSLMQVVLSTRYVANAP